MGDSDVGRPHSEWREITLVRFTALNCVFRLHEHVVILVTITIRAIILIQLYR